MPALGVGTWRFGEQARRRQDEVAALSMALDAGCRLVDTAEMYGDGTAEEIVGEAIAGRRDRVFLVSKVYPHNATRRGMAAACERSLRRLDTDRIDLYLLHWRGSVPLAQTVEGLAELRARGLVRHWGVSNFDTDDMKELWDIDGGRDCALNQVYYSASRRGIEFDLLPWLRERRLPVMAYCPLDQGMLSQHPALVAIGKRHHATAAQVALAWLMRDADVVPIPKAARGEHVREDLAAADIQLSADDLAAIDRSFPPPARKTRLAVT